MSATGEGTDLCGEWMPKAGTTCGRRPSHPGKHITAQALKQQVDNRPRKTTRRVGVRLRDDPVVVARWRRAAKFNKLGISEERFNQMLAGQDYACAMCRRAFEEEERIFADHDHNCCPKQLKQTAKTCGDCIRGLLCFRCNTALGYVEQYADLASAYLGQARPRQAPA